MGFEHFPVLLLIVCNILVINCQSLLGAVENIFGINEQPINQNANQRYTVLPTANTQLYNYPVHHNLQGNNLNYNNRDPNRNRLNTFNNLANLNSNKNNGLLNPTNVLNLGDHKNVQNSITQKINQGNYEDEDVKIAAQQFPGLQKLLDKLREMNKQKELEKNGNTGQTTAIPAITTTDNNNKDSSSETIAKTNEKEKIKSIRRRKFYFQVQPVVPEDLKKENDFEIVYYED
nr:putative uncharacterized protein DDB_G0282499 [Plodia interpunctella]